MKESSMDNDTSKLIREHKHNYAGEFGNVVVDPFLSVLEELIKNPTLFEEEEKQKILEGLIKALHSQGSYDLLGYNLSEQIAQVKETIVPEINENCELLKSILSKYREFDNSYIPDILNWSISHTQSLSLKLLNIQNDDKGVSRPILLLSFVDQLFREAEDERNRKGKNSFKHDIFGRNLSDLQVFIDPDGFKTNVIHNIIENIHKYAFPETNPTDIDIEERMVRISFSKTSADTNMVTMIIENNGMPFEGDIASVFNDGYHTGKGTGIGMFSASKFLDECGGNIAFESTPNNEYTVHFIIKLPIYGKV